MVIEAELDKGRGAVATVLVQKGTLHVGDFVACGMSHGRVRAMIDDKGKRVKEAGPSMPVEILGLDEVPEAGEIFVSPESEKEAQDFAKTYNEQHKKELLSETRKKSVSLVDIYDHIGFIYGTDASMYHLDCYLVI
jgi:translation initiation factor IF-2